MIINDGVMGGRSKGEFNVSDDLVMKFKGNLSLENNGGFSLLRSRAATLGIQPTDEAIVMNVRGDGRKYSFYLFESDSIVDWQFKHEFDTVKGEKTEVRL